MLWALLGTLLLLLPLVAAQGVTLSVTDPTGGAYHAQPEPISVTATNQFSVTVHTVYAVWPVTPTPGVAVYYQWQDADGNPLAGTVKLENDVVTTVASPTRNFGFLQLTITADPPLVLPNRNLSEPVSYGFVIATPRLAEIDVGSLYGTVGGDPSDPYLAPWMRSISWSTHSPAAWSSAIQTARLGGKLAYGMFAGNSTGGVSWDTLPDESGAITVDQLDDIEEAAYAIFASAYSNGQNFEAAEIELGFEETLSPRYQSELYFPNLAQKALAVRRAAVAAGAANIKLTYQIASSFSGSQVLSPFTAFLNSVAASLFDNIAIHAYPWPAFAYADAWMPPLLNDLRSAMATLNQNKSIRFEIGIPMNDPPVANFTNNGVAIPGATQGYAASYMWRASMIAISMGVQRVMWREYQDIANNRFDALANFGLRDFIGYPQALYSTLRTMQTYFDSETTFVNRATMPGNVQMYHFQGSGNDYYVLWTNPAGSVSVELYSLKADLDTARVTACFDRTGRPCDYGLTVTATAVPIFIVTPVSYTANGVTLSASAVASVALTTGATSSAATEASTAVSSAALTAEATATTTSEVSATTTSTQSTTRAVTTTTSAEASTLAASTTESASTSAASSTTIADTTTTQATTARTSLTSESTSLAVTRSATSTFSTSTTSTTSTVASSTSSVSATTIGATTTSTSTTATVASTATTAASLASATAATLVSATSSFAASSAASTSTASVLATTTAGESHSGGHRHGRLAGWAIALIVLAVLLGLAGAAGVVYIILKRREAKAETYVNMDEGAVRHSMD